MRALVGVQQLTSGTVQVFGEEAGQRGAARPDRLRHPGRQRVRRPHRRREPPFFARVLGVGGDAGRRGRSRPSTSATTPTRWSAGSAAASAPGPASRSPCSASPDLLVLDEPTVGLDPVLRRDLWALFHRLADAGAAVFVSSHVMDEADRCDRLLLMREGRIIADDTPDRDPREDRRRRHRERLPRARRGDGRTRHEPRASPSPSPRRVLTQLRRDHRTAGDAAGAARAC